MQFAVQDLVRLTGASIVRWPGSAAVSLIHDVRNAGPGKLYVPLYRGTAEAGLFQALVRAGASGIMTYGDEAIPNPELYPHLGVLKHPAPLEAYCRMAREARERSGALVVALTGSAGKSATKEYLAAILGRRFKLTATNPNHHARHDCAETLLRLEGVPNEAAIIEMGFGFVGDIDRMAAMAKPNCGLITNITADHLDGAGTWEMVAREKGRLGLHLPPDGTMVMHAEDPGCGLIPRQQYPCKVFTFGTGNGADLRYSDVIADETGTRLTLHFFGQQLAVKLRTFGTVQAANAAAAALVAHTLGLAPDEIQQGLAATLPLPRRFTVHRFTNGLTLIDDTFSASYDPMSRGLETAAALAGDRRKIALLSGAANLADRTVGYHQKLGEHVVACGFTHLVLVSPDERIAALKEGALAAGLPREQIQEVPERGAIPAILGSLAAHDTVIYCKTSQQLWVGPEIDTFCSQLPARGYSPLD